MLGNVYVLGPRAAERMARGEPPGCWVSPGAARDRAAGGARQGRRAPRPARARRAHGRGAARARLCRRLPRRHARRRPRRVDHPARAGARRRGGRSWPRSSATGPRAASTSTRRPAARAAIPVDGAPAAGPPPVPGSKRLAVPTDEEAPWRRGVARLLDGLGRLFPVTRDTALRRALARLAAWADRRPAVARAVERVELAVKQPLFGCQACGNCVLGHLEYVCPETCPKHLRNGPCGGTLPRALRGRRPAVRLGRRPRARAAPPVASATC